MPDPNCKRCKGTGTYRADPAWQGVFVTLRCGCVDEPKQLWEILVPTVRNDGRPFRLRYHKVWDAKVREITGGLTVLPVATGQWMHKQELYKERMIPVRIYATRSQIDEIINFSLKYYDQIAIMCYKVAEEVILKYRS